MVVPRRPSPYTPGAGAVPLDLPGREQEALVLAAQDFPEAPASPAPEPLTPLAAPQAHDTSDEEEGPVWA